MQINYYYFKFWRVWELKGHLIVKIEMNKESIVYVNRLRSEIRILLDSEVHHYFSMFVKTYWHLPLNRYSQQLLSLGSLLPPEVDTLLEQLIIIDQTNAFIFHAHINKFL